jgi:acyl dehydratase
MLTINSIDELKARAGEDLGVSEWHEVTQAEIDTFAEATGDHQWIHVDPERARDTPFGGTIAHGYYTLALASRFMEDRESPRRRRRRASAKQADRSGACGSHARHSGPAGRCTRR